MKINKMLFATLALSLSCVFTYSQEEIPEAYQEEAKEMLRLTGSQEIFETAIDGMIDLYKERETSISEETWDELGNEFKQSAITDLNELLIPIYHKHLTLEDLKAANAFYRSSAGQKFTAKLPMITQESMAVGAKWGEKIGEDFVKRLEEKGY